MGLREQGAQTQTLDLERIVTVDFQPGVVRNPRHLVEHDHDRICKTGWGTSRLFSCSKNLACSVKRYLLVLVGFYTAGFDLWADFEMFDWVDPF